MAIGSWPTVTDDSGAYTDGTVFNRALIDAIHDALNTLLVSSSNPSISAASTIDAVKAAAGSTASLDARLDVILNEDGTIKTPAGIVTSAQLAAQAAGSVNLMKNSTFWLWSAGLTSAPDYWTFANGGSISICGIGQTDTTRKIGKYCVKLTFGSNPTTLKQVVLDTTDFANLDHLKLDTKKIGFGMWVKTGTTAHGKIGISDGDGSTLSSAHTGGGAFEWLEVVHTMSAASTKLVIELHNIQTGDVYFSGGNVVMGDAAPGIWVPEPKIRGHVNIELPGTLTVGNGKKYFTFARPVRLDHIQGMVLTDPVSSSINIDVEKFEPTTSWVSMGTAGALIDDGDGVGQWLLTTTDADYDHRCLSGWFGASGELAATGQEDKMGRLNIDQIGSGTAGADLFLRVDGVQCIHPFEEQLSFGNLGA